MDTYVFPNELIKEGATIIMFDNSGNRKILKAKNK